MGVTLPSMSIMPAQSWVGAHESPMRFLAIDINHGPGDVEWWALEPNHTENANLKVKQNLKLNKILRIKHQIDSIFLWQLCEIIYVYQKKFGCQKMFCRDFI